MRNFASAKKQMRIENLFVQPASESPLIASDRAVYLAKICSIIFSALETEIPLSTKAVMKVLRSKPLFPPPIDHGVGSSDLF